VAPYVKLIKIQHYVDLNRFAALERKFKWSDDVFQYLYLDKTDNKLDLTNILFRNKSYPFAITKI